MVQLWCCLTVLTDLVVINNGNLDAERYILDINAIAWPARSPDLNSIGHIWNFVRNRPKRPNNLKDLKRLLLEIWVNLGQNEFL